MPQICSLTVLGARGHWAIRVSSYRSSQGKPISLSSQLLEVPEFFGSSPPPSTESSLALTFVISWIPVDPGKSLHLRNLNLTKPFLPCRALSKNQDQDIWGPLFSHVTMTYVCIPTSGEVTMSEKMRPSFLDLQGSWLCPRPHWAQKRTPDEIIAPSHTLI